MGLCGFYSQENVSSDNGLIIFQGKDDKYRGYMYSASVGYELTEEKQDPSSLCFEAENLGEAIEKAQEEYTEYGYHFVTNSPKTQ